MSAALKPNHVWIEVVAGCEGPHLSIGDDDGGERVAGPKAWGGGHTIHRFQVSTDKLRELANQRDEDCLKTSKEKS